MGRRLCVDGGGAGRTWRALVYRRGVAGADLARRRVWLHLRSWKWIAPEASGPVSTAISGATRRGRAGRCFHIRRLIRLAMCAGDSSRPWRSTRLGDPWVTLHRCGGASCDTGQYALFHIADDTWTYLTELHDHSGDLAFGASGDAWLCADTGLYRITSDALEPIGGEETARCRVEADPAGRVWLALPGRSTLWRHDSD